MLEAKKFGIFCVFSSSFSHKQIEEISSTEPRSFIFTYSKLRCFIFGDSYSAKLDNPMMFSQVFAKTYILLFPWEMLMMQCFCLFLFISHKRWISERWRNNNRHWEFSKNRTIENIVLFCKVPSKWPMFTLWFFSVLAFLRVCNYDLIVPLARIGGS